MHAEYDRLLSVCDCTLHLIGYRQFVTAPLVGHWLDEPLREKMKVKNYHHF